MIKRIIVYNPDAKVVHRIETNATTFGELTDELGLMPDSFKYVCSYNNGTGFKKISLDFVSTVLPEVASLEIYFFPKKNMSGISDNIAELAERLGLEPSDILLMGKAIGELFLEKINEELKDSADLELVRSRIQTTLEELGYV